MSFVWGSAGEPASGRRFPVSAELDDARLDRLADELASMVSLWEGMIDRHRPDRTGNCRHCAGGGEQGVAMPWPCLPYGVAERAGRRYRERWGRSP